MIHQEHHQMGSQTLEILRQGVWASLTGGWFFDPHQDVFCNTFHLYIWLFLLCLPFTIYVYFPPTRFMWYLYCFSVAIVFAGVKLANYALHRMYDTSECVREEVDSPQWSEKRDDEPGIEMQVLKAPSADPLPSTDADSVESTDFQQPTAPKTPQPAGTIDLKVDVHRKNSSESSDGAASAAPDEAGRKRARGKHQRAKAEFSVQNESEKESKLEERRHSNFTNSSLSYLPSRRAAPEKQIKATGSLELAYLDKNPNQPLTDGFRRIRSTALETCCPPPALAVHPNSLEVIGCKGARNPLPPPSSTLVRNQHLNLYSYYGSEIVYPIAEQSDEHGNSHGPDTDVDSSAHISDSDFEDVEPSSNVFRKRTKKHDTCKSNESEKIAQNSSNCTSLVELDLDWLFDDENHRTYRKEPLKRETDWSSSTSISLEHDVSKVLQEPLPSSAHSLGAIPKKLRPSTSHPEQSSSSSQSGRKTPKSESDKCAMCRCKSEQQTDTIRLPNNQKEHKITQTIRLNDVCSAGEGLECIVMPSQKAQRINAPKRSVHTAKSSEEGSSGGSNNELSTLLPPQPLLSAFLSAPRRDFPPPLTCLLPGDGFKLGQAASPLRTRALKRNRVTRRRSCHRVKRDVAIASSLSAGYGTHSARNFNDTTDGAVHCFLDEHGNCVTYTFDEKGLGMANVRMQETKQGNDKVGHRTRTGVLPTLERRRPIENSLRPTPLNTFDIWHSNSTDSIHNSAVSIILDASRASNTSNSMIPQSHIPGQIRESFRRNLLAEQNFIQTARTLNIIDDSLISIVRAGDDIESNNHHHHHHHPPGKFKFIKSADQVNNNYPRTKSYYKFKVFPWTFVKVSLDRLKLLALLDRNLTLFEALISTILGILVSVFGAVLLYFGFYEDFFAFIFCFIMASCQYSLLKSVQPDAASPTHGFNRIIAYSRPIYFCLFSGVILILNHHISAEMASKSYSFAKIEEISRNELILISRDFLVNFILFFPVLFSLGLFPQINTFVMYLLEQVDMYVFGGNAMSSLLASFYCIFRSVLAVCVMQGFAYGGLSEAKSSRHVLFSIFCACLVACSYHLSRSASDPLYFWNLIKRHLWPPDIYRLSDRVETKEAKPLTENGAKEGKDEKSVKFEDAAPEVVEEHVDPLPGKLQKTVNARLMNDLILCALIAVLVFSVHASTVFTALQPELSPVLWSISAIFGFVLHYVFPQLRKQLPWMCIARPLLRSKEFAQYQIRGPAKIMWFERIYVYLCFVERNVLYPLLFLSVLTEDAPKIVGKYGPLIGSFIVVICGLKCLRSCYSNQNCQYLILSFTALFFHYDYKSNYIQETFLVEYFFVSIAFHKVYELLLKVQFVVTYIAPWQITWGSAFHAFAQPFSVPHSAMLFLQAIVSAILSTPLNPFLGSAIFLTSYVRPVKFWERDYNTRRVDHSNTPLSSHLDRNLGADDNNLNSIFYEHLTRSLQHSLCGDLIMGRWGLVHQGDCFVLASDYLNCLVHIIEVGNGLVTFQMRGLEFRGTYCQQREVEAITEGIEENDACCCVETDHFSGILSISSAFSQRWLAWEVTTAKYILEGYSISDNSAVSMLQVFEFRKVLISYYVKSIIFYTIRSPKLAEWLTSQTILKALQPIEESNFVDLDPVFNYNIDEDYDIANSGMTRAMFCQIHGDWITFCVAKTEKNIDSRTNSTLVLLCFALSLLGRRALGAASHNTVSSVEFFLYGLHALFKGDFRLTCTRDEWVFTDMDLLKSVVAPGVRMSLKLHQDHFTSPDEYEELPALYEAICKHEEELVISHEGDPAWRSAVLSGTPSLLALRHVLDDGTDEYKIIMLNKRYLSFRVIKINRECVRGLWAGQQQELVYLRNRNPERGSIQNAKQALRNIINSSCDQPIGYPIYVSPLTTSYAETNEQFCGLVGGSVSLGKIKSYVFNAFRRIRKRCGEGCSSGASTRDEIGMGHEGVYAMTPVVNTQTTGSQSMDGSHLSGSMGRGSSLSRTSLGGNRGSLVSMGKPTSATLASLTGLFKERDERAVSQTPDVGMEGRGSDLGEDMKEFAVQRVKIVDPNLVYDAINLGRRIDVAWPTEYMKMRGGRSFWKDWVPEMGMEGPVVHRWTPCHKDPGKRSHVDRTILLVQIDDKFVPIAECGVQDLGQEV